MNKFFYSGLYVVLFLLVVIFFCTSIPAAKLKIFNVTHPNWIQLEKFQILNYEIKCSSPWGRGGDKMANLAVSYQYNYGNKSYFQQDQVFYRIYKTYIFEGCDSFKEKNKQLFNRAVKDQTIKLFINENSPNKAKLFLTNKEFNYRLSWLSIFFSEIQGILLTLLAIVTLYSIYMLFNRR
ncbi:hypothetical protein KTI78_10010 [Acinetobacter sp. WU_MDCI_Abxe161]|uniref:hypothetical protein n=1 Tax=Acinetobacter sp. WU_MDCI_Abxe161 TaxID=2850074 RepID=UPI0021CDABC1|nr:hypothetical protein [Acinetobacter sp. WU_MDCI_Abxe161]MCU4503503.1 hypothetical protein [Acinetobacter sp. WU_MDCI_Abxe161]